MYILLFMTLGEIAELHGGRIFFPIEIGLGGGSFLITMFEVEM